MSEIITCKSCGNQFQGNYCNVCGEKVIRKTDRQLKHFLGEFIKALTFADNKLWRSVILLISSPGKLSKEFVSGRRKPYMRPISLFFLANLIYFLFPLVDTFTTRLDYQLTSFAHSDIAEQMVSKEIQERGISLQEYKNTYDAKTTELSKLLLILMSLMLAVFFLPIHKGGVHNLLADHVTIGLEIMTFILVYCIQILGIISLFLSLFQVYIGNDFTISTISAIIILYFFFRMEKTFYQFKGARLFINTFFTFLAFVFVLYSYRAILFFITFWSV